MHNHPSEGESLWIGKEEKEMIIKKTRKIYEKPRISEVKLEVEEAILAACKTSTRDSSGRGRRGCRASGCRGRYGS